MEAAEEERGATEPEAIAPEAAALEGAPGPAVERAAVEVQQGAAGLFERRQAALEEGPREKHSPWRPGGHLRA